MASNAIASGSSPNSGQILKRARSPSPENVVVILPDESCFEYAIPESKKARNEAKMNWSIEQTKAIIQGYKENQVELEKADTNKTPIWEKIVLGINEKFGTAISADCCTAKWRSLKSSYKKVEFSSRSEASKKKWAYYEVMHSLLQDVVHEPEPKTFFSSTPSIINETPTLHKSSTSILAGGSHGQPTIKIITEPTAVLSTVNPTASQEELNYPVWFKQFYQVYRKNEETKIALLAKIKGSINVMADRQCKAIEKLNEHLSKLSGGT